MHKILVIKLHFPLDAIHVSECMSIIRSNFYKLYIAFGICRYHMSDFCLTTATQQPDVPAYTKCDVQLIKAAPDDGLI